jgi:hypothetical protein
MLGFLGLSADWRCFLVGVPMSVKSPTISVARSAIGIDIYHSEFDAQMTLPFAFVRPMAALFERNMKGYIEWYDSDSLPYHEAYFLNFEPFELEVKISQAHGENMMMFTRNDFAAICRCALVLLGTVPIDEFDPESFDGNVLAEGEIRARRNRQSEVARIDVAKIRRMLDIAPMDAA